ncbi:hypothetical protein PtA15_13A388 [Puccinia triticina]|uniref:Uncharacterized protein n=1 Tax=Puccinia triticina TaxID=208348 RepID=A0ABY7D312_9BASI|nr:uncharacterized protein PtA15_13A388 [Puccinia triticina]WAQ90988.1 hypothetical protein PtA15_13A388 [Puccinia triticina]WAR61176.1 hypothetical protein PtB15_13B428 [Puccinia triticina]
MPLDEILLSQGLGPSPGPSSFPPALSTPNHQHPYYLRQTFISIDNLNNLPAQNPHYSN